MLPSRSGSSAIAIRVCSAAKPVFPSRRGILAIRCFPFRAKIRRPISFATGSGHTARKTSQATHPSVGKDTLTRRPSAKTTQHPRHGDVDSLVEDFGAVTKAPASTREDLRNVLIPLMVVILKLPARRRNDILRTHVIGSRALLFVWNRGLHETKAFHDDFELINALSALVVAEERDDFIEQWILTNVTPDVEQALGKSAVTWRASLWKALVAAEVSQTAAASKNFDAPIRRFFHLLELRKARLTQISGNFNKMSAWPATKSLTSLLKRVDMSNTSPQLMDNFLRFLKSMRGKYPQRSLYTSLCMFHPTKPDPYPYLEYARSVQDYSRYSGRELSGIRFNVRRMLDLLHNNGDVEGASWAAGLLSRIEQVTATKSDGPVYFRAVGKNPHKIASQGPQRLD